MPRQFALSKRLQPTKFRAVSEGGFDSRAEARRYRELLALQGAGAIADLERQVSYRITPPDCPARRLIVDFRYRVLDPRLITGVEAGSVVCEDVKSPVTETPVWRLKWLLARYYYRDVVWVTSALKGGRAQLSVWPAVASASSTRRRTSGA